MTESGQSDRRRFESSHVVTLAGAHFVHDVFSAFLPALLPLLIKKLGISLFQAGLLDFSNRLPSIFNPILGALIDRGGLARALVILSPSVTGTTMCLMGLAPSYSVLLILLLTGGLSVAALHVSAPAIISEVAGDRMGRGMSFFMVGGELARTVGPLVAVQAVVSFSLAGLWRVIPVAALASAILWWRLSRIPVAQRPGPRQGTPSILADVFSLWKRTWRIVLGVLGLMMARAFLAVALVIYLPTFIHSEGGSLWFANISLSVVQLAGAVGALASGTLSDWFGRRRVLTTAVVLSPLFMFLFLMAEGVWILPVLTALGFFSLATTPVMMAIMIENAGADKATANGTFMTIAFGMRSFVVLLVGAMGDVLGLRSTFALCGAFAVLAIPFVFILPRDVKD